MVLEIKVVNFELFIKDKYSYWHLNIDKEVSQYLDSYVMFIRDLHCN